MKTRSVQLETYADIEQYLNGVVKGSIELGLDRVRDFLELLGNPQKSLKCVHIAGTNGKGSVVKLLESALIAAGYKVATYTSPHLVKYNERWCINNIPISDHLLGEYLALLDGIKERYQLDLTVFEILSALAFKYFADESVDIALIEVGLGGRLDATNVIEAPLASVITHVDIDHTSFLGDTINEIAAEKAGIIKKGCPILVDKDNKGYSVIKSIADQEQAFLFPVNTDYYKLSLNTKAGNQYVIEVLTNTPLFTTRLLGDHQRCNSILAYKTLKVLTSRGFNIPEGCIQEGFAKAYWPARAEYRREENLLIDGAHNPAGAEGLRKLLDTYFKDEKRIWILSILETKDQAQILKTLISKDDKVILPTMSSYNAHSAASLRDTIRSAQLTDKVYLSAGLEEAFQLAKEFQQNKDLVILTGSLYMIGDYFKMSGGFYG